MSGEKRITISCKIPELAKQQDVIDFIEDALRWAGGCRPTEDPMFDSLSDVKVVSYVNKRR